MNSSSSQNFSLSQKRYAIARLVKYIQLFLMFILLFVPIFGIYSEGKLEDTEIKASASVSAFQVLIGDTDSSASIFIDDSDSDSVFSTMSIDVVGEAFSDFPEEMIIFARVAMIVIAILVACLSAFTTRSNQFSKGSSKDRAQQEISNQMYVTRVYDTFPVFFELIEKFISIVLFINCFIFCSVGFFFAEENGIWRIDVIAPLIFGIITICLINGFVTHIICSKDINEIKANGQRFEEPYDCPTIASDIKAISGLFGLQTTSKSSSEQVNEAKIVEALQQYKTLLDSGVITQEEYQKKKDELLNKNNQ